MRKIWKPVLTSHLIIVIRTDVTDIIKYPKTHRKEMRSSNLDTSDIQGTQASQKSSLILIFFGGGAGEEESAFTFEIVYQVNSQGHASDHGPVQDK